ncbi:LOW QUALITY PROTEIN: hypothetical protein CVT26_001861 [Gymnopilus dilepis]|uniref:Uncharacterized protein n=1 Tax=Gymnopilus dilepis TaxID=231916 RepID=A0A409Y3W6_9AGAR|nr:LOW QUALITY PROTEIN: hypothetical protein CVT26_001861 [Gymnopilus dilepis]
MPPDAGMTWQSPNPALMSSLAIIPPSFHLCHDMTRSPSHTPLPPSTLACTPASPSRADRHEAHVVTWPLQLLHAASVALSPFPSFSTLPLRYNFRSESLSSGVPTHLDGRTLAATAISRIPCQRPITTSSSIAISALLTQVLITVSGGEMG